MSYKIGKDRKRFKRIVRGKVRDDLQEHMSKNEIPAQKGDEKVSIPMPEIELPKIRHGDKQQGGVGMGDGEVGDPIADGDEVPGEGDEAGEDPGDHAYEPEIDFDDLAEIMAEELELPDIESEESGEVVEESKRYSNIDTEGPEGLRHFKRTFKESLKREIASGDFDPEDPAMPIPRKEDKRYKAPRIEELPEHDARILYVMDISGSMGQVHRETVQKACFWINLFLDYQYEGVEERFIVHDVEAEEVDEDEFFRITAGGGTKISSGLGKVEDIYQADYSPEKNLYVFHFSDGDNWSPDDSKRCVEILEETVLPWSNLYCYGQVKRRSSGSGFISTLETKLSAENMVKEEIDGDDEIYDMLKCFLGKGL